MSLLKGCKSVLAFTSLSLLILDGLLSLILAVLVYGLALEQHGIQLTLNSEGVTK